MTDALDEELAALRARAYGPGGGIADDPLALARLRELEQRRVEARESADAAEPPDPLEALFPTDEPAVAASVMPHPAPIAPPVVVAAEPPVAPVSLSTEPPVRRLDRRLRLTWIASLAVMAVLATGITAWTLPWGVRDEQHHEARLTAQPGEVPLGVRNQMVTFVGNRAPKSDARYFGEYEGLKVYATDACLAAVIDDDAAGIVGVGCAAGDLDVVMDVYVFGGSGESGESPFPETLRSRMPDGGIVRFTMRGDVVDVDEASLPTEAS